MAAAAPVISGITGIAGLYQNMQQARNADRMQGAALDAQARNEAIRAEAMAGMEQFYAQMREIVDRQRSEGVYSADRRIETAKGQIADLEGRDMGNLAATMATAGMKPGDSEMGTRLDSVKMKNQQYFNDAVNQIMGSVAAEELNAENMTRPDGVLQAAGLSTTGGAQDTGTLLQLAQQIRSRQQNPAALLQMMMESFGGGGGGGGTVQANGGQRMPWDEQMGGGASPVVTSLGWTPSAWPSMINYSGVGAQGN